MSDTAFSDDASAESEDLELEAPEADVEAEEDDAPAPEKDWQKIAHDKEGALAKERSRRKAEAARARQLEERLAKLEGAGTNAKTDAELLKLAESLRDDDDDPITDIAALKRFAKQYAAEQRAALQQDEQQSQQQRAVQQISRRMEESEADFAEDNPDYYDAAKFFREQRREELEEMGFAGQRLARELSDDLLGIVHRALQAGRDPAEAVYNLARKRGFGVDGVAKKLQTIANGQQASRSIASGGAKPAVQLSPGAVANLKGAAFDAAFEKLRAQARRSS